MTAGSTSSTPEPADFGGCRPVALIILDGWGVAAETKGNAVRLARTPVFDGLIATFASTSLRASGPDVGLPDGQMGNSEVGHQTLGAGLIIDQDLVRIRRAIENGSLARSPALLAAFDHVRRRGSALHLAGLLGDGGVHGHTDHLLAIVAAAKAAGLERVYVHAFTDGRDTAPDSALGFMERLESDLGRIGVGRVATVCGRYWAMDRDKRWERTERAWRAMVEGGAVSASGTDAVRSAYAAGELDEFITPRVVARPPGLASDQRGDGSDMDGRLGSDDAVILFNFRADRVRQLLTVMTDPAFDGFADVRCPPGLHVLTMTQVAEDQRAPALFAPQNVVHPLARVIADAGLAQYHAAETEKYAHVTYFFNGGHERPFPGETHALVPSPKVPTYDLQPEMSAVELTDSLVSRIETGIDDFILLNYANPDMVGHTGVLEAAIRAVETVDTCLGRVLAALALRGGSALVTADHGNCEQMIDPLTGRPHTAHTCNPVPCIVVHDSMRLDAGHAARLREGGALRDVAPTILGMLGLARPVEMTGRTLIETIAAPAAPAR